MKEEKDKNVFEAAKYKCPVPVSSIKKGDILFCQSPTTIWLCIISHIGGDKVYYYANYNLTAMILNQNDWFLSDYIKRPATPEEKELLMQVLDKKGLAWIVAEKKIFGKDEILAVPGAVTLLENKYGRTIDILHPKKSMVLMGACNAYGLVPYSPDRFRKINCLLVPCKYPDLKPMDVAYRTKINPVRINPYNDNISDYVKILGSGYIYTDGESITKSYDTDYSWYKVIIG